MIFQKNLALILTLFVTFCQGERLLAQGDENPQLKIPVEKEILRQTVSSGQPVTTFWSVGAMGGIGRGADQQALQFYLKVNKSLAVKPLSLLNWEGTAGLEKLGDQLSLSFGGFINLLWFSVGARYRPRFNERRLVPVIAIENALGRGGTFGLRRAELRAEWSPGVFTVGLNLNLNEQAGQHRPKRAHVNMPEGDVSPVTELETRLIDEDALISLKHAVLWLDRFTTPAMAKDSLAELKDHIRVSGHFFEDEDRLYHDSLEKAFMTALGEAILDPESRAEEARKIAEKAERTIFEEIIIPFNRLLGQRKRPMSLAGLGSRAAASFGEYIDQRTDPSPSFRAANQASREIFRQLLQFIEMSLQCSRYRWKDDRLAEFLVNELGMRDVDTSFFNLGVLCWVPLNYGLRPSQYDTQAEMNDVLGELLGEPFTAHNKIAYLINEQWYYELLKTIRETKHYHVLIIHDYPGINRKGLPDKIAWEITLDGYCEAILKGIDDYLAGRRETLPHFSIFLDQYYYELWRSRIPITFLESLAKLKSVSYKRPPRDGRKDNIEGNRQIDDLHLRIGEFQKKLASALVRLRKEKGWSQKDIERQVKVHINITNKASETYGAYTLQDDVMRDHRKIAFRDVFEDAPCWGSSAGENGVGIFAGQGVGEHYMGGDWEDRSLKVEGVDLVKLKTACRELFLSQSPRYKMKDVPYYLRPRPHPENCEAILQVMSRRGFQSHVTTVMNRTGYAPKTASVLKAALYNLIPRGGTIIAPDSQWNNDFWLGMFAGAALRGVNTYLVGPSAENTPGEAPYLLGALHNSLLRGMVIAEEFKEEMAKSGGSLNIGLFNSSADATDLKERLEEVIKGFESNERLGRLLQVHPGVPALLREIRAGLDEGYSLNHAPHLVKEGGRKPRLHLKAQFFASQSGMDILKLKEWMPLLKRYFEERVKQTTGHPLESAGLTPELLLAAEDPDGQTLIGAFERSLSPQERDKAAFFLTVGSHNQNRRSMFLDGEDLVAVAGPESLIALMDIVFLLHSSVWPRDFAEFKKYLPESSDIGNLIKDLL
jgi:hypothetical protein